MWGWVDVRVGGWVGRWVGVGVGGWVGRCVGVGVWGRCVHASAPTHPPRPPTRLPGESPIVEGFPDDVIVRSANQRPGFPIT